MRPRDAPAYFLAPGSQACATTTSYIVTDACVLLCFVFVCVHAYVNMDAPEAKRGIVSSESDLQAAVSWSVWVLGSKLGSSYLTLPT